MEMNIRIAKKYGVDFQNRLRDNGTIKKIPYSKLEFLNLFLFECKVSDIDGVDEGLLNQIDDALTNSNSEIESGCGIVDILIYRDVVKFYINDDIDSMPTVDFREIIVGWRDFLLQPPLNGTSA
ncbi:hypothetical protein ABIB62_004632 [Mucilaginibacter sp. UYP25]|uniref:hypothetical protein n=1 Tax=unclassified Mucilaginibacter TaxID=2617802 RepID=UPI003398BBAD